MRTAVRVACTRTPLHILWLLLTGVVLVMSGCAAVVGPDSGSNPPPGSSTPVTISNVQAMGATSSAVHISWMTSAAANSQVDYGTASKYGTSTPVSPAMVLTHQMALAGLNAGTLYHYRVRSTDANGNAALSTDETFTTAATGGGSGSGDTTPPTVKLTAPTAAATVSGIVTLTATATDNVGVASVQFQVDGANAGVADAASPYTASWDTTKATNGTHSVAAIAKDAAGNTATSSVNVTVKNATLTFSISGMINPAAAGGSGATVKLSGATTATTTANGSGAYTFSGLANGTYTVTPSNTGFTFAPLSANATINGANIVGLNFTATKQAGQTFSISGTISPAAAGNGATVKLSGAANATTTANASGAFTFAGLANGAYTVTPGHAGFTFAPASANATVNGTNITGVNFAGTAQTFSISGTVSPAAGGGGATVKLSGAANATTTASSAGVYTFTGLANGTYTVTPSNAGFTFAPLSANATVNGANIVGLNFTATKQTAPTFSVTGTISPAAAGNGATVKLSGAATATVTANSSGVFTFTGLANGAYTVTPSHAGFTFAPSSANATVNGANVTAINFTGTAPTFSVSGTITPAAAGNGATVKLSGAATATTTANTAGTFTFTGLANGAYTVTPSHAGFTFAPASVNATVNGANITGVNFAGTVQTFSISGTISPTAGGSGATVKLSGAASGTTTTNSAGAYTFSGLANGTYTVTPSNTGFTFAPVSANATINGANIVGLNFTATKQAAPTFSITGTISPAAAGNGATVKLGGAANATTTANSSGVFTFAGLANGAFTVTPSHAGFTFAPDSANATVNGANVTGVNFAGTAQTFSISGTITPAAAGNGATVKLSGAATVTVSANSSGVFTFTGLTNGAYTVTPSHAGFTFAPSNASATINGANVAGVNFAGTAQTFSISGTITPAAAGNGATVKLSGAATATTTANTAGTFTFTGLANGAYTVTPSHTGFTFAPGSANATINGANVTAINFTGTAQTFSISGTISPAAAGNGATVKLSGAATATVTANGAGAFTFTGLANGTYTVTPSHVGFTFAPGSANATINGANVTAINFTGTAQTFSISGTISPAAGGSGATVALSGAHTATTTANNAGAYTFTGLANGSYVVTPSKSGFTFGPTAENATINGANVTGVNFTATTQVSHSVSISWTASSSSVAGYNIYRSTVSGSGYIKLNSTPVTGLTYKDTTVQSGTTYFYVATAITSSGTESGDSNQATAIVP